MTRCPKCQGTRIDPTTGGECGCEDRGQACDSFLAEALCADHYGPTFWRTLTDAGRAYYLTRFSAAIHRANAERALALLNPHGETK